MDHDQGYAVVVARVFSVHGADTAPSIPHNIPCAHSCERCSSWDYLRPLPRATSTFNRGRAGMIVWEESSPCRG